MNWDDGGNLEDRIHLSLFFSFTYINEKKTLKW